MMVHQKYLFQGLHFRRRNRKAALLAKNQAAAKKPFSSRFGDNIMIEKCTECGAVLEQYDDDTIGVAITVLATFIHREPALATPMLLDMLKCVSWSVQFNGI